ncbi:MAG: delta-60 repeat domain-containing protein [Flavobacteriales bacterium]|nr:delta-60 repeat domain-containing protein [Flavobacteriales bacterium]
MIYRLTTFGFLLGMAISTCAQPGTLDPTFNPIDIGFGYGDGATGQGTSLVLPNGQILLMAGQSYNSEPVAGLIRLNPDGTRDMTFLRVILLVAAA